MFEDYNEPEIKKEIHAYWIHDTTRDEASVKGYFILPTCICSNCKTQQASEREICPKCGAIMDKPATAKTVKSHKKK